MLVLSRSLAAAAVGVAALGIASPVAAAPSAASSASGCAPATSTASRQGGQIGTAQSVVRDVRVGAQNGCDRIVLEFSGTGAPGYSVSYVNSVVADPSGRTVPLEGHAFLHIVLHGTSTSTHAPQPDLRPHFRVLRELRGAGDFEAVTSYGAGLASRQPFAAYRLANPERLVIDIKVPAAPTSSTGGTHQVTQVPTGGVGTGAGGTSRLQHAGLLGTGAALMVAGGGALALRRRIVAQR